MEFMEFMEFHGPLAACRFVDRWSSPGDVPRSRQGSIGNDPLVWTMLLLAGRDS